MSEHASAIAIIGLSLRFPGASDARSFWSNLISGVDSVTVLDAEQRARAGHPSEEGWVAAAGVIEGADLFDARFFGYSPREAEQLDPQQRLFMECCWEALEAAGYTARARPLYVGVYGGASLSSYLLTNVLPNMERRSSDWTESVLGTHSDFLATRVAYKLNLTGPAMTVQTACSTSLTAVHLACQSLLAGECTLALAGGAAVRSPQLSAYPTQEGGISSPDGHCRAFDAQAAGTVPGNGVGVVLLKRLEDALADGDPIRAVILGSAANNDGSGKAGFTAPSVSGQVTAIGDALALAGVEPGSVSYIEAHGTGTPLGDPVEVTALKQVFEGVAPGSIGLGSVKSNLGHLDSAAGVAGLIKTVLALEHRHLPPTVHFRRPNPLLGLDDSPFYVVAEPRPWSSSGPRRAGVSSFGMGGTNVHVVLEEAPVSPASPASRGTELLLLSARSDAALERMTTELAEHLEHTQDALADIAHTLQVGRHRFEHRSFVTASTAKDAAARLRDPGQRPRTSHDPAEKRGAVFLFPGAGSQRVNMGAELLDEPVFRQAIDRCAALLRGPLGADVRDVMFAPAERYDTAARELSRPLWTQAALFTCDWALAQLWLARGVQPEALLGHSLGEYVAACVAGVFTLEEALELVTARGRIMEQLPPGGMTAVLAPVAQVEALLHPRLSVAALNTPSDCVIAGALEALDALESELGARGIEARRLRLGQAAHSFMLEPHLPDFARVVSRIKPRAPKLPIVSSLTGDWLTEREAVTVDYWCRHLRETVRFSEALHLLLSGKERAFIEVGPGTALSSLTRRHPSRSTQPVVSTLPYTSEEPTHPLASLGEAWLAGITIDWERFRAGDQRRRVTLPGYSFDRERYWIEPVTATPRSVGPREEPRPAPPRPEGSRAAPPRDDTEATLLECFRLTFHLDNIGIHDDFFALGGDSLLALRLSARIQERLGAKLPLKAVLEASTVARLAERISGARPTPKTSPDCVVQLQTGTSSKAPLFFVHAAGGQVLFYRELARQLAPDRSVYGFSAVGLESDEPCLTTVEQMAAHYVAALRVIRPTGPYLLIGASLGGTIVYEMARRLSAEGEAVPLCALLDTPPPGSFSTELADRISLLAFRAGEMFDPAAKWPEDLPVEEQFRRLQEEAERQGLAPPFATVEDARRQLDVLRANSRALSLYTPPRWEGGEVQYFRARRPPPGFPPHPELGWLDLGAATRVDITPGDHYTMLQAPHVEVLGAKLARLLP
ncbi:type I polyketide synthase [Myxococcus sp. AS-1-15]|uniref:type I polyketide synthase n=1 Tax=Myxococcus sp. AS-1-15 TaxID=2874600 RepID=UPI001CBEDE28|nr:type I polyketide synthase [Myxococcus sp. AS-1-15]MBZ4400291.1 alpha/beta fold hydrolase [Myxococcus sp. AS-1-15]